MSLGAALSNAMSGLGIASKSTELISSNIANASNPTYGRRTLSVSSRAMSYGGAEINAINRAEKTAVHHEFRTSLGHVQSGKIASDFLNAARRLFGSTQDGISITNKIDTLRTNLLTAAAAPNEPAHLTRVATAASGLANQVSAAAKGLDDLMGSAKSDIKSSVATLNKTLETLHRLNVKIGQTSDKLGMRAGYLDQRDAALTKLAELVPFKIYQRDNGKIALYTPGGQALLDGRPNTFEMTTGLPPTIRYANQPEKSLQLDAGKLGGLMDIVTSTGPKMMQDLDGFAIDLATAFSQTEVDATLTTADQGVFQYSDTNPAASLAIDSTLFDEPWRIRDGLNAAQPNPVPDNRHLNAMIDRLTNTGALFASAQSMSSHSEERAAQAEMNLISAQANTAELDQMAQSNTVNTDQEMQHLLVVEQAYQANAKIIEIVDQLYDQILRIG